MTRLENSILEADVLLFLSSMRNWFLRAFRRLSWTLQTRRPQSCSSLDWSTYRLGLVCSNCWFSDWCCCTSASLLGYLPTSTILISDNRPKHVSTCNDSQCFHCNGCQEPIPYRTNGDVPTEAICRNRRCKSYGIPVDFFLCYFREFYNEVLRTDWTSCSGTLEIEESENTKTWIREPSSVS